MFVPFGDSGFLLWSADERTTALDAEIVDSSDMIPSIKTWRINFS